MVIDTSALLAVLLNESDRTLYETKFAVDGKKYLNTVNKLEADIVMTARFGDKGKEKLDTFLFYSEIEILPFIRGMEELAFQAWLKYGKGRHKASLNMGDCCAYATAKSLNEPLLFKGDDFTWTDIKGVIGEKA